MRVALLFPGQGAQYVGMGKDYWEGYELAAELLARAELLLNRPLRSLLLEGPEELLTATLNSQVALFVTAQAQLELLRARFPELEVSYVAGFSLGEYNALVAAGCLSFDEALLLVQKRAQLMHSACDRHPGSMAALLGFPDAQLASLLLEAAAEGEELVVANYNGPGQRVISGHRLAVERACLLAAERGARGAIPLKVAGAFHSPLMAEAQAQFERHLMEASWLQGSLPIALNSTAQLTSELDQILPAVVRQMAQGVLWEQSIAQIEQQAPSLYLEVGAGKTLTSLQRRMGVDAPAFSLDRADGFRCIEQWLHDQQGALES